MAKRKRERESDYLRFRPYHAFTTPAVTENTGRWTSLWRYAFVVAALALLAVAAMRWSHH